MNIVKKALDTAKNAAFHIAAVPFVLFSSVVIHLSGAEHDTWPSEEKMKAGGVAPKQ